MSDAGQPNTDTAERPQETPSPPPTSAEVNRPSLPPPSDTGERPGAAPSPSGADATTGDAAERPQETPSPPPTGGEVDRPSLPPPSDTGEPGAAQVQSGADATTGDRPSLDRPAPSPDAPPRPEPSVTPLPPETGQTPQKPEAGPEPSVTPLPPETGQAPQKPEAGPDRADTARPPDQVSAHKFEGNEIPREIVSVTHPSGGPRFEFDRSVTKEEAARILFQGELPSGVGLHPSGDGATSDNWQVSGLSTTSVAEMNGVLPKLMILNEEFHSRIGPASSSGNDSQAPKVDPTSREPTEAPRQPTPPATDRGAEPSRAEPQGTAGSGGVEAKANHQPEAAVRLQHPDGSVQQRETDGTNTFQSPGGSTISIQPNGAVVTSPDVTLKATPDGGVRGTTKDGQTITASSQGDMYVRSPNGDVRGIDRNGSIRISTEDGTRETIAPDGTRLVQNPDNTTKTIYPDGSSKALRYTDGTTFPGGDAAWPDPGPLRPDGPPQNGVNTYTDPAGNRWVISDDGHQTIHTDAGTWERDPQGNITIREHVTGNTWYQGTDGSQRFTDGDGNLRNKTDPDGQRWVRDSSGEMVFAGRPHVEWTSPDGTVTVTEINGNYFRISPEGREISLGGDRNWQKVPEDAFHGTVANSQHLQHVHETPHHPGQESLAYSDALLGTFMAAADFGAQVVMTAAEWGAFGPWGVAGAALAGVLDAKSPGEAALVLADAFMPGPPVGKHAHVPAAAGHGHLPTAGLTPHVDLPPAHVHQSGAPDGVTPHHAQPGTGTGTSGPPGGTGHPPAGAGPSHPPGSAGPNRADVWAKQEDLRGREIQDVLAGTEYESYVHTDDLGPGKNFPAIDFVSADGTHGVSVKTVNPYSKAFTEGNVLHGGGTEKSPMGLLGHADELVERALVEKGGSHVTLDIRVPPGTPEAAVDFLRDTILDHVDDPLGRLEVVVRTFP